MAAGGGWGYTKIGAGPIPIETSEGWLLIFHGAPGSGCAVESHRTRRTVSALAAKPDCELSAYAGRLEDGTITLLVINKHRDPVTATLTLSGVSAIFNGSSAPADDLSDAAPTVLPQSSGNNLKYVFAPISVTLLRLSVKP